MARALPVFHALTGCDTVSSFAGHGKKDCVGCMDCVSWAYTCPVEIVFSPKWHTTGDNDYNWEVYYLTLWLNQHMHRNRYGKEEVICKEATEHLKFQRRFTPRETIILKMRRMRWSTENCTFLEEILTTTRYCFLYKSKSKINIS